MKIIELYRDHNIQSDDQLQGWINTACPFCDDPLDHLGFSLSGNYFNCWRCGWHPVYETLSKLLSIPKSEVHSILAGYRGQDTSILHTTSTNRQPLRHAFRARGFRYPSGTGPLTQHHKNYIQNRGFDPDFIEKFWNVKATGPFSYLESDNALLWYKWRLLAPVTWNNDTVSFQARDITGKQGIKYKACPEERELIKHKHILYGKQECWGDHGICVEGIFDAWRFGSKAFAVFGIQFTESQVRIMSNQFKEVTVIFDNEPQATAQANKLVAELRFRGVKAKRVDIVSDPADMSQDDANYLIRYITGG